MARKDKKRPPADAGDPRDRRVTAADIQGKEFRESFRGYNEHEVDEFLDLITEEVARLTAETKRMQEQADFRQTVPLGSDAEEVLRRARDEAARIVADARARAAVLGGSGGRAPTAGANPPLPIEAMDVINRYLGRERDFLRSLASTVQAHMEAVKADTKATREMAAGTSASEAPESGASPPTPEADTTFDTNAEESDVSAAKDDGSTGVFEAAGSWATEHDSGASDDSPSEGHGDLMEPDGPPTLRWGETSSADPPASVDLERGSVGVRMDGPHPAVIEEVRSAPTPEEDAGEDRSLKELFWGED